MPAEPVRRLEAEVWGQEARGGRPKSHNVGRWYSAETTIDNCSLLIVDC